MRENKFLKLEDSSDILSIIEGLKSKESQVLAWSFFGNKKVTSELYVHLIRKARGEFILKASSPLEFEKLQDLITQKKKINFYLNDEMALFQSEIKFDPDSKLLIAKFPTMIAQINRRKFERYSIQENKKVDLSFSKEIIEFTQKRIQSFKKKAFDLSCGGFSFVVSKSEKKYFNKKDKFFIEMNLGEKFIYSSCVICSVLEIEPTKKNGLNYKGLKIGVQFVNMEEEYLRALQEYIALHFYKIETAL